MSRPAACAGLAKSPLVETTCNVTFCDWPGAVVIGKLTGTLTWVTPAGMVNRPQRPWPLTTASVEAQKKAWTGPKRGSSTVTGKPTVLEANELTWSRGGLPTETLGPPTRIRPMPGTELMTGALPAADRLAVGLHRDCAERGVEEEGVGDGPAGSERSVRCSGGGVVLDHHHVLAGALRRESGRRERVAERLVGDGIQLVACVEVGAVGH